MILPKTCSAAQIQRAVVTVFQQNGYQNGPACAITSSLPQGFKSAFGGLGCSLENSCVGFA